MFIRNRRNYLVLENLKQAREYLTKKKIPIDLPEFKHIVDRLNDIPMPNLIDTFTRMVFTDDGNDILTRNLPEFDRVVDWIKDNKNIVSQLPKNINQYDDIEHLADDISKLNDDRKVDAFIKSLYKSMRDRIGELEGTSEDHFRHIASAFMDLDNDRKSQFTPLKYFEKNDVSITDFINCLDKFINGQDVNENKKRIFKYIEENPDKLTVKYNKNDVLVIQTNDGSSVIELGSQKWCIVYSPESYQNQYFGPDSGNTQYIIHNFNLPTSSRYSTFGITIDIHGDSIRGGCQDKSNSGLPLEKVYELTEIPKGTISSLYEKEYGTFSHEKELITNESSYEDLLNLRNFSIKLRIRSETDDIVKSWLINYINKLNLSDKNYDEFIDQIRQIENKTKEMDIFYELNDVKFSFMNKKVDDGKISSIPTIENLIDKLNYFLKMYKELNLELISSTNTLTTEVLGWITNNIIDNDVEYNLSLIRRIISVEYSEGIENKLGVYFKKFHDTELNQIIEYITKDRETLMHYFIEENSLINVLRIPLNSFIENRNYLSLSDSIFLLYVYIYHIRDNDGYGLSDEYRGNGMIAGGKSLSNIPKDTITTELILDYINSYSEVVDRLMEIPLMRDGEVISSVSLTTQIDNTIPDIIENYMNVRDKKFELTLDVYLDACQKLKDYLDDTYIRDYACDIYYEFNSKDDTQIFNFFIDSIEDEDIEFDIEDLLDDDHIYDREKVTQDYLKFIGDIYRELKIEDGEDEGLDKYNTIELYSIGISDPIYMNEFKKKIGLKYEEESDVWYMNTNYDELGGYFQEDFDFGDFREIFGSADYDYYNDHMDDIDIGNLKILSMYFKSNGFPIDISPLRKYDIPENKNDRGYMKFTYKESTDLYQQDRDLRSLLSTIENIVTENYDYEDEGVEDNPYDEIDISEIQRSINQAYERADNSARESEYFDDQASQIGNAFLIKWEDSKDNKESFGDSYFKRDNSDTIMVIPDLNTLINDDNFFTEMTEQCGVDSITIEDMISMYLDNNGSLSWADESGYASFEDSNYDYFNEELSNELFELIGLDDSDMIIYDETENENEEDLNLVAENTNNILKLSDYLKLNEKQLSELNNPEVFISQFEDEERAIEDLEYYTDMVEELNTKGGEVYRLVFLEDLSDLDENNLGEHWCLEITQLSNFYESLNDQMGLPYLITGLLKPGQINVELSYGTYEQLPYELEVNLISDPDRYDIKPYKDTHSAKRLWESMMY